VTPILLASALPILFWTGGSGTAPLLENAGFLQVSVPNAAVATWSSVHGIKVQPVDFGKAVKLPAPGVDYHMNAASASRVPWVNSNGWRFIRQPGAEFAYDARGTVSGLAAAEAFAFGSTSLIATDEAGLRPLGEMLKFLRSVDKLQGTAVADIGFIDDGSSLDAEVMNLLVRENLLFEIVPASEPRLKLTVKLGSNEYQSKNANELEHQIRSNLEDRRRSIRIYGTSVVVTHVIRKGARLRIHLLNYGADNGTIVGAFRVRVLGQYESGGLHSFGSPHDALLDFEKDQDATEFTVPGLKTYAIVDLTAKP
jgi:hypothetical protein